jgi:hypothetical protein
MIKNENIQFEYNFNYKMSDNFESKLQHVINSIQMKIKAGIEIYPRTVEINGQKYLITYTFDDENYYITTRLLTRK